LHSIDIVYAEYELDNFWRRLKSYERENAGRLHRLDAMGRAVMTPLDMLIIIALLLFLILLCLLPRAVWNVIGWTTFFVIVMAFSQSRGDVPDGYNWAKFTQPCMASAHKCCERILCHPRVGNHRSNNMKAGII
jgi:hypothetical protein